MENILNFYIEQIKNNLSNILWLSNLQKIGLKYFMECVKHLNHNAKHKVNSILKNFFIHPNSNFYKYQQSIINSDIRGFHIIIQNGLFVMNKQYENIMPKNIIINSLSQTIAYNLDVIKSYLNILLDYRDIFQALNTAFLKFGTVLYIPKNVIMDIPIVITHYQDQKNQAIHNRLLIIVESCSTVSIIEDYLGSNDISYFTNTITEIFIGKKSKVVHYKIQREGKSSYHIGGIFVKQDQDSYFENHIITVGGMLSINNAIVTLKNKNSLCNMNGIYVANDNQNIEHYSTIHHQANDCTSNQNYKGILYGKSISVFHGRIIIEKQLKNCNAIQLNKNLLCSNYATIKTIPQLNIFTDNVLCKHGATIGKLDQEILFYLYTRGINKTDAIRYLVQAFINENLKKISCTYILHWIKKFLNLYLI